ncbi:MAG: FHA domain-containing protein [Planctomycetes bacterium]|nr:FHA domain-containing protein [Planctomycetota bacterium]NOG53823.1 Flp pilus assembly complex ATPase component TadA [Planctomycetota bacterium]
MPTFLEMISDTGRKRIELSEAAVTIGRHPRNAVVLADERGASRFHCVIERSQDGTFVVRDLQSRNGVWFREERLTESAILEVGDTFRIGKCWFRVSSDEDDLGGETCSDSSAAALSDTDSLLSAFDDENEDYNQLLADLSGQDDGGAGAGSGRDYSQVLEQLARIAGADETTQGGMTLIDARGRAVHAGDREAISKRRGGKRSSDDAGDLDAVGLLQQFLLLCARAGATDLHCEPKAEHLQVRIRVDGMMIHVMPIESAIAARLYGVVKVLSEIDITQKHLVQEGHFSSTISGRRVDYRISFTPTMHGQKLVIRVLDLSNSPRFLNELELPTWMYDRIQKVAKQDSGMVLACGPTGSGKTTTLYAILRDIDVQLRNVITIEDPVEYEIDGVTQMPINADRGNTFDSMLRSVLRQDPDVILLGEIRDQETANTAMQAAMTGHLVLTTVHAKDTIGSVFRLLDLGVEPFLIASSLHLVLAQRLVRMLCHTCRIDKKPTSNQTLQMGKYVEGLTKLYVPAGCDVCLGTGFQGRQALFELLVVTDDLRDVILKTPTIHEIREQVKMTMFTSLRQSGFSLALKGDTSFEEVERVVGVD